MHRWLLWLSFLLAACPPPEQAACDAACDTLVTECGFAAFPDRTSCLEGCALDALHGSAVGPMSSCLVQAECDPHAHVTTEPGAQVDLHVQIDAETIDRRRPMSSSSGSTDPGCAA